MKTSREIKIQLNKYMTRRANIIRESYPENAAIIFRLNEKIVALRWVLGIVE